MTSATFLKRSRYEGRVVWKLSLIYNRRPYSQKDISSIPSSELQRLELAESANHLSETLSVIDWTIVDTQASK